MKLIGLEISNAMDDFCRDSIANTRYRSIRPFIIRSFSVYWERGTFLYLIEESVQFNIISQLYEISE